MSRIQLWLWMLMFCALALIDACASRENAKDAEKVDAGARDGGDATGPAVDDAEGEDAPEPEAVDDAAGDDETSPAAPFLGDWTLTGTSLQQCPTRTLDNNAYSVPVSFFLDSEDEAGREADLYFDPGLGCSLPMVVRGSEAVLRSAPVLCQPLGSPDQAEFSSVQVAVTGSVLTVVEKAASVSCSWVVEGTLSR